MIIERKTTELEIVEEEKEKLKEELMKEETVRTVLEELNLAKQETEKLRRDLLIVKNLADNVEKLFEEVEIMVERKTTELKIVEEEKERLKEELMKDEGLRKEKEDQIDNLQEQNRIKDKRFNSFKRRNWKRKLQMNIGKNKTLKIDEELQETKSKLQREETVRKGLEEELNLAKQEADELWQGKLIAKTKVDNLEKSFEELEMIIERNTTELKIVEEEKEKLKEEEVEDRLNLVTEGAKILKQEKEDMEVEIDWLEILVMQIDDIVKQQKKKEILRREEDSTRLNKELIEERIRKQTESEVESLRREIKTLKQRLLAKTGQIGYTQKVVMELADLMNQLEDEINSDDLAFANALGAYDAPLTISNVQKFHDCSQEVPMTSLGFSAAFD
ncbi:golgin subfamily A member 6-like protein 22 [Palaemon carinicauda]|uniref:golgin subfamily A member 6-like protein 22 n=1 Tax=Palaemon carinicauda TaxID=392227 RepID=UPI0035B6013A